jgi:hypothetical protein
MKTSLLTVVAVALLAVALAEARPLPATSSAGEPKLAARAFCEVLPLISLRMKLWVDHMSVLYQCARLWAPQAPKHLLSADPTITGYLGSDTLGAAAYPCAAMMNN